MNTFTGIFAVTSTLMVMATSTAFAGLESAEQYLISRQDTLSPTFPAGLNPAEGSRAVPILLAPGINPHWGPTFDLEGE